MTLIGVVAVVAVVGDSVVATYLLRLVSVHFPIAFAFDLPVDYFLQPSVAVVAVTRSGLALDSAHPVAYFSFAIAVDAIPAPVAASPAFRSSVAVDVVAAVILAVFADVVAVADEWVRLPPLAINLLDVPVRLVLAAAAAAVDAAFVLFQPD